MREWMGMPPETEGILVSGGSVGTLTALAAAAHDARRDRDEATGYVQEHTHAAVAKAWRMLGFNPSNLRVLRADPAHRLQAAAVDAARPPRPRGPPAAVRGHRHAPARPSTGSVDALNDLADLAQREGMWFHVDGAYGAPARLTPSPDLLDGIERADSLVLDPHKWLFQPYEIGAVLVRHHTALEQAFALDGAYLRDTSGGVVEFRERGPQLTRSARALKLYLSLQVFGLDAFKAGDPARHRRSPSTPSAARARASSGRSSRPRRSASSASAAPARPTSRPTRWCARAIADGFAAPSTTVLDGPHRRAAVHDQPAHHQSGHRAHDRAPEQLLALRHLNTRHVAPRTSDLRRSDGESGQ